MEMNRLKTFTLATAIWTGLVLTACGSFTGTYETANGIASVSFQSGKAFMTLMGSTEVCEFDMKGDRIVVHTSAENVVFTRNEDGTIDGPLGNMKKRRS
jgi:hypothetical protein